jgi:glycosyltransferase involved in cell wall biosynthesis
MSSQPSRPTIALVYDRVNTRYGGAENVLLALHQAFPQAPLFTALYSAKDAPWAKVFPQVKTSFLNRLPFIRTWHRWLAWLMPLAFESFDLSQFNIVISVTSAEAKGVLTKPNQLHICYLLTPPRYLYQSQQHSLDAHWLLRLPIVRQLARLWLGYLKWWDQAAIFRPDVIIPISERVAVRIKQYYPAVKTNSVIYPPINLPAANSKTANLTLPFAAFFLIISRLVSYKHLDLAIKACKKLGKNLVVVGHGPELSKLRRLAQGDQAKSKIIFLPEVNSEQLAALYRYCQAVIMPGVEDFGLVALEANAYGKPVIINHQSGAAELIKPGVHGIHLASETVAAVTTAIKQFDQTQFSPSKIAQNPVKYDTNRFVAEFAQEVNNRWQAHLKSL